MLGTIAGIWISTILVIFGGLMLIGVSAASSDSGEIKKNSILHLQLKGFVLERYQPSSLFDLIGESRDESSATLDEMLQAIRKASDDKRIDGIYLDCRGAAMGMATREELVDALRSFKESGKWIYAYADNYTQGDYILASCADSIFLNPAGACDIHGIATQTPFFTGLMDKLGVKMQILKVGSFKSAVEPYFRTSMSDESRLQTQVYIDSIWNYMSGAIAEGRGLKDSDIKTLASQMIMTRPASDMLELRLADSLCYRRGMEDFLRGLTDVDADDDLRLVSPSSYMASDITMSFDSGKDHVAVLYALGEISDNGESGIVGNKTVEQIIKLADDDNVRGMVMRVNSPGGSAFASEQIWEALEYFKSKDKPLYVSMGDYAASGGYYISCGADSIFAEATTLTGSIGVFGMIPDFSGLVTGKLGVTFGSVASNENAAFPDVMKAMTPFQQESMQRSVDEIYRTFTGRVASGRGLDIEEVLKIAEGRVWVGTSARELGLVDGIATLEQTVDAMTAELGLDENAYVQYPDIKREFWEEMLLQSDAFRNIGAAKAGATDGLDKETLEMLLYVGRLRSMAPIQARMEPIEIR